ncbi:MAG: hypothetical protein RLZZ475_2059 [Pseudomonadota bacterium]
MRPVTLYFHGLPGSAAELAAFGPDIAARTAGFHVAARGGDFARLAEQTAASFPDGPLRLVGFSLGAAAALRVAPHLGERVERIDLVSPAAPLQLGDFLGQMAGAPVFRAALATDPRFIAALAQSLRHSLLGSRAAYTSEIRAYVADWRDHLSQVHQPVAIWQGSEDDWTPPAMAEALAAALPLRPEVTMLQGLSHFSTLRAYLAAEAGA